MKFKIGQEVIVTGKYKKRPWSSRIGMDKLIGERGVIQALSVDGTTFHKVVLEESGNYFFFDEDDLEESIDSKKN